MTNNCGLWQLTINTTVIGELSLLINVTDNAGNSNTSVNILLNASDTTSPVISCPDDMLVEQNVSENITWKITEIHHWLENLPVGDYVLSTPDIQEVIAMWLIK